MKFVEATLPTGAAVYESSLKKYFTIIIEFFQFINQFFNFHSCLLVNGGGCFHPPQVKLEVYFFFFHGHDKSFAIFFISKLITIDLESFEAITSDNLGHLCGTQSTTKFKEH